MRTGRMKKIVTFSASAIVMVALLVVAFRGTDFRRVLVLMREANYWWIALNVAILLASHALRALRWRYLLHPIKPNIGMRSLFSAVMVGYMMNNLLPRAGELARPYAVGKMEGFSKTAAFGTIVVERLIDTASFLVLVAVVPLVYDGPLNASFPWLRDTGAVATAVTVLLFFGMALLMFRRDWTDRLLALLLRLLPQRLARRSRDRVHSFLDGLLFIKTPRNFLAIVVLSILIWFLYVVMTFVAFFAFGIEQQLGFGGALVVLAIQSIGIAIPTPGGTGGYHAFTAQTLIRLFAVDSAVAVSYATVTHAASFVVVTLIGLSFVLRDHLRVSDAVRIREETKSA
jgi:uncharacterized protein (TIRG00374 family)